MQMDLSLIVVLLMKAVHLGFIWHLLINFKQKGV
jgi:hypothetical protein